MIAVENDGVSTCDNCERRRVAFVKCEGFEREFLCSRCAGAQQSDEGRKTTFSYQTDTRGHRKGKDWSKGGRR